MSMVVLVITGASLIALSILHEDKKIDDGGAILTLRPHSHCVFNDPYAKCFSPSEWDGRWDAQKAYRRQLSERILALLASQESGYGPCGKHSSSFWIDDVGDILGPWEKNHA